MEEANYFQTIYYKIKSGLDVKLCLLFNVFSSVMADSEVKRSFWFKTGNQLLIDVYDTSHWLDQATLGVSDFRFWSLDLENDVGC